jgi:hypothetical protein
LKQRCEHTHQRSGERCRRGHVACATVVYCVAPFFHEQLHISSRCVHVVRSAAADFDEHLAVEMIDRVKRWSLILLSFGVLLILRCA